MLDERPCLVGAQGYHGLALRGVWIVQTNLGLGIVAVACAGAEWVRTLGGVRVARCGRG